MFKFIKKQNSDYVLILAVALLLVLVSGVIWSSGFKNRRVSRTELPLKIIGKAVLTVDFGEKGKRAFEGDVVANETLIDVLNQSAKAGGFSFELNEKSDVASVGNLVGGSRKSWHWYLNGEKINKKPNEITAKSGDRILIRYE